MGAGFPIVWLHLRSAIGKWFQGSHTFFSHHMRRNVIWAFATVHWRDERFLTRFCKESWVVDESLGCSLVQLPWQFGKNYGTQWWLICRLGLTSQICGLIWPMSSLILLTVPSRIMMWYSLVFGFVAWPPWLATRVSPANRASFSMHPAGWFEHIFDVSVIIYLLPISKG